MSKTKSEFRTGDYYRWVQKDTKEISPEEMECPFLFIGFKVTEIPEFKDNNQQVATEHHIDNLLRQKIFIDGISNIFQNEASNLDAKLEFRMENDPILKLIDCYLILKVVKTSKTISPSPTRLAKEFEKLIPEDYQISRMSEEEILSLLSYNDEYFFEIRRNTDFVAVGDLFNDPIGIADPKQGEIDQTCRYLIPVTSYVEPKTYNLINFYRIFQSLDEKVQFRISLGITKVFQDEKDLAQFYAERLSSSQYVANGPETAKQINAFAKYHATDRLFTLTMQVASEDLPSARLLADTYCSSQSFGDIRSQLNFTYSEGQKEKRKMMVKDWTECQQNFYDLLLEFKPDESISELTRSFILRLPYLADSAEAMALFRLPVATTSGLPGFISRPVKPFYQPNPSREQAGAVISIGKILFGSNTGSTKDYAIPYADLNKHGLIVGATGSGKTNTTLQLIEGLIENDINFLMIEPVKSEYYERLTPLFEKKKKKLYRFKLDNPYDLNGKINDEFLKFNPFIPREGIGMFQHLSYIKSCLMAAFPMYGIMPLLLDDCLMEYIKSPYLDKKYGDDVASSLAGLKDSEIFDPYKTFPYWANKVIKGEVCKVNNSLRTLTGFADFLPVYFEKNSALFSGNDSKEMQAILKRRLIKLTKGILGHIFCPELWRNRGRKSSEIPDQLNIILNQPCIIELDALPDNEDKALIMAFLLSYLFEDRQTPLTTERKLHVTLIEEAHRLLSSGAGKAGSNSEGGSQTSDSASKTISLFVDMLAEIRAKNEGIFIIEQSPTKLVADVIKNTNLKIMHRITNRSDRQYLGDAMNMDEQQIRYATTLKSGHALIFEEQLDKPILVKINKFKVGGLNN